ncbi:hypothetical protein [Vibrio sagamiensis]|uniref:DUF333 domain-containing protein n=1 Tax=Vibrio sagamiensis NBRC 104589 TaxID=1219064 RepID=A0A511QBN5_9VIBR|nr:hypothetical protein [Vibrio sagamiensis]GEM74709.1 hypothetical protein VSA01S_08210 [Vibrio sagamiensis NBRC 104589]
MRLILISILGTLFTFGALASSSENQGAGLGKYEECINKNGEKMYVPEGYCQLVGKKH